MFQALIALEEEDLKNKLFLLQQCLLSSKERPVLLALNPANGWGSLDELIGVVKNL